jgi:hypothetical protein
MRFGLHEMRETASGECQWNAPSRQLCCGVV